MSIGAGERACKLEEKYQAVVLAGGALVYLLASRLMSLIKPVSSSIINGLEKHQS